MTAPAPHRRRARESRGTRPAKPTPAAAAAPPPASSPVPDPARVCEYAPGMFGAFDRPVTDPAAVLLATAERHITGKHNTVHRLWRVSTVDGSKSVDCAGDQTMRTLLAELAHRQAGKLHRIEVLRFITGATAPNPRYRPPSSSDTRRAAR